MPVRSFGTGQRASRRFLDTAERFLHLRVPAFDLLPGLAAGEPTGRGIGGKATARRQAARVAPAKLTQEDEKRITSAVYGFVSRGNDSVAEGCGLGRQGAFGSRPAFRKERQQLSPQLCSHHRTF